MLNVEANVEVDFTAMEALDAVREEITRRGAVFALARVKQTLARLQAFGLASKMATSVCSPRCPRPWPLPQWPGRTGPAPEIGNARPVDGALHPGRKAQLVEMLHDSLGTIIRYGKPSRIDVTASGDCCLTVIDTRAIELPAADAGGSDQFAGIRAMAAKAGVRPFHAGE